MSDEGGPGSSGEGTPASSSASRRDFVRIALRDSVKTASQLAGLSGVVATTAAEAGRAMRDGLIGPVDEAAPRRTTVPPNPAATAAAHPASAGVDAVPALATEALPAQSRSLLIGVHPAVLATLATDGSPLLASGWVRYDGRAFVTSGREFSAKVTNARRDGRVSLVVTATGGDALHINGVADVRSGLDAVAFARDLHEEIAGPLPAGWGAPDDRGAVVLVEIVPLRALWRPGGAPP